MSSRETSANLPHKSKKKKQAPTIADNLSTNGQAQHPGANSKKRGRPDNIAEDERPRKKRNKDRKKRDGSPHLAESASVAISTDGNQDALASSATTKEGKKKHSGNAKNGANLKGIASGGMTNLSPNLHENGATSSQEELEPKKRKKRKDKQSQAIIPADPQLSLDLSDIPIDPLLLEDFTYGPNAFPFNDTTIDFSTFGMGPGSTTEDIMRAIKTMDLSTLSQVTGREFVPVPPVDGQGTTKKKRSRARTENLPSQIFNPSDPQGLLRKWLSAEKLKKLAEEHGLEYSKGAFTATEKATVQAALESFAIRHNLSDVDVVELLFMKKASLQPEHKSLWHDIAASVPQRPIVSVFNYCRRAYHPLQKQGKWTLEEDEALKGAIVEFGQQWIKVSGRVGRTSHDCRDRYRNQILDAESRVHGAWSQEEEARLVEIMAEFNYEKPKGEEHDTFWREISCRMGGSRARAQIRTKWQDSLSKTFKPDGGRRWQPIDSYILVHKVATMNVADDSEIDWSLLGDEGWNLWSPHVMQKHWFNMKKRIDGYENMPFYEILEILIAKKGSLSQWEIEDAIKKTQEFRPIRAAKEFISQEVIEDSDEALG